MTQHRCKAAHMAYQSGSRQQCYSVNTQPNPTWQYDAVRKKYFCSDGRSDQIDYNDGCSVSRSGPVSHSVQLPRFSGQRVATATPISSQVSRSDMDMAARISRVATTYFPEWEGRASEKEQPKGIDSSVLEPIPHANAEQLSPDFKLRSAQFFRVGRVFNILWTEPAGGSDVLFGDRTTALARSSYGMDGIVYSKVRRFVVIREGSNYCSAVPIVTYARMGVAKPGVVKSEHAIVYTGKTPPQVFPEEQPGRGEHPILPVAIRVDPDNRCDNLHPASRLDFGKVYTVQHNLKVKAFGLVNQRSIEALINQFRIAWSKELSNTTLRLESRATTPACNRVEKENDGGKSEGSDHNDDIGRYRSQTDNSMYPRRHLPKGKDKEAAELQSRYYGATEVDSDSDDSGVDSDSDENGVD